MCEDSQQDSYYQGAQCFNTNGQAADNPYSSGSVEFQRWEKGFYSAAAEDFNDHRCGADASWTGSEKFCEVCGKKLGELE